MEESEVEERYSCAVCCEVYKEPTLLPCQHRLCGECVRALTHHGNLCPVCRRAFTVDQCVPDGKMESEIVRGSVQCRGCKQQCSLLQFNAHSASCVLRQTTCSASTSMPTDRAAAVNRLTYSCPICDQPNLDCMSLVQHCNELHAHDHAHVVCPVCAAMPWGNPTQVSRNFVQHLTLRHCFEYDTFVDYEQDEDLSLQAVLKASITDK